MQCAIDPKCHSPNTHVFLQQNVLRFVPSVQKLVLALRWLRALACASRCSIPSARTCATHNACKDSHGPVTSWSWSMGVRRRNRTLGCLKSHSDRPGIVPGPFSIYPLENRARDGALHSALPFMSSCLISENYRFVGRIVSGSEAAGANPLPRCREQGSK